MSHITRHCTCRTVCICMYIHERRCCVCVYLYDCGWSSVDNMRGQSSERAALYTHESQLLAESQLIGQGLQVRVVIDVEFLEVLQCSCEEGEGGGEEDAW